MKVLTLFGTRPEIIRLSIISQRLDELCDHVMVHTGQNFDQTLSDLFIDELGLRAPDNHLGIETTSFGAQVGQILSRVDELLERVRPDRVLILGDTNSGLAAIVAARRGIPVFHLEAGNRSYDDRVPEEINRRVIDHSSTVLLPYTFRSKDNLIREGIDRDRVFVVGNPICEVMNHFRDRIDGSDVLERVEKVAEHYFLVTMHRAENVDDPRRLSDLLTGLEAVSEHYDLPVVMSLHPRTGDRIKRFGFEVDSRKVQMITPVGFFDLIRLEENARCVLTDSGTVQEECSILRRPNVTIRDVTERAETVECGSNILAGSKPESLLRAVEVAVSAPPDWRPPPEYLEPHASSAATKIVLGFHLSPIRDRAL